MFKVGKLTACWARMSTLLYSVSRFLVKADVRSAAGSGIQNNLCTKDYNIEVGYITIKSILINHIKNSLNERRGGWGQKQPTYWICLTPGYPY